MDRVDPLKIERPATGGTQTDIYPTGIKANEDGLNTRGLAIQNDTSDDDAVVVSRDASSNMTFKDAANTSEVTLTELLEAGDDDDQVKDNVASGDSFTVKEEHQHIIHREFKVDGEFVVDGESVVFGGEEPGGGGGISDHEIGGQYHDPSTLAELNALISDATLDDASAARAPTAHGSSHAAGQSDAIKLDDLASPDDNTDLDATSSAHGLLPKLSGDTDEFLRGDGAWAEPAGAVALQVFDGIDTTGGTTVGDTWVDVPLNAEGKKTSGFTHSTTVSPAEVTIVAAGTYRLTADVSIDQTSVSARSEAIMRIVLDEGSGFNEIEGTRMPVYSRNTLAGGGGVSRNRILDFSAGDVVKIQAQRSDGTGGLVLYADGSGLTLEKLG